MGEDVGDGIWEKAGGIDERQKGDCSRVGEVLNMETENRVGGEAGKIWGELW